MKSTNRKESRRFERIVLTTSWHKLRVITVTRPQLNSKRFRAMASSVSTRQIAMIIYHATLTFLCCPTNDPATYLPLTLKSCQNMKRRLMRRRRSRNSRIKNWRLLCKQLAKAIRCYRGSQCHRPTIANRFNTSKTFTTSNRSLRLTNPRLHSPPTLPGCSLRR